ncbi:hypothetical protein EU508_05720 [Pseudoalteromonas fuliginea]|uniref:Haem-binding uptake Tiki superfamily ChaN domain-containing protein n=1 Tax=Pseudoalteromonas fuliginea TaxID=1872678 RepID=A0AB73BJC9_9GAMM|nr:DUF5694 domain-containing protein [Pseudoalteromonas fuliginea]KAA1162492.1 hypothetical protein EU508_05720 [Pseudoalteromonas fuliginea]
MKNTIYLISALIFTLNSLQIKASAESSKAEVSMLGVFHFHNPGLDVVQTSQIDVSKPQSQAYLEALTSKIGKQFIPTQVLLECERNEQGKIDKQYASYLRGDFELPINESYQIGFRVAKKANAKFVTCFDERKVQWQAEGLMNVIAKDAELKKRMQAMIKVLTDATNNMHNTMTLREIMRENNKTSYSRQNKALYLLTNDVGGGSGFEGADAAASWWHRNFRMYANIQKVAQPGERVLVIAGHGHIAILNDLLDDDMTRKSININLYL